MLAAALLFSFLPWASAQTPVLIIDGQNNHQWKETTPVLKRLLEESGLFRVDVATTPPKDGDMSLFHPDFARYRVVVSNYNGEPWTDPVKASFEKYMRAGGGLVSYHAADNSFPEWGAYNEMVGVGGWGNRDEKAGPYWYFQDGTMVADTTPGRAGSHGARVPFAVTMRDSQHPIARGLPPVWMHAADELYCRMRGPGRNLLLLATAFSDPGNKGTGRHEPMLFTISYGKGRIFHTTLGHDLEAISSVGFIATFQRGTEWAATGKVTQKVPPDFPTADRLSVRRP
jgi:uncharacterized protein